MNSEKRDGSKDSAKNKNKTIPKGKETESDRLPKQSDEWLLEELKQKKSEIADLKLQLEAKDAEIAKLEQKIVHLEHNLEVSAFQNANLPESFKAELVVEEEMFSELKSKGTSYWTAMKRSNGKYLVSVDGPLWEIDKEGKLSQVS